MAIVAHTHPFVIGADTHARNHAISILASPNGEVIDDAQFPTTAAGVKRAVAWAGRRTGADLGAVRVIEGTGTYGARLARVAAEAGYTVVEAAQMNARANRGLGKSDPSMTAASPKPFSPGRDQVAHAASRRWRARTERTATINALIALLRVTDLGIDAVGRSAAARSPRSSPGAPATKTLPPPSRATRPSGSQSA